MKSILTQDTTSEERKKKRVQIKIIIFALILFFLFLTFHYIGNNKHPYGVFIGADSSDMDEMSDYEIVVIDAQEFTAEEISELKVKGHTVYSYLNIGSLEGFRDYYYDFKDITLDSYKNWQGEYWIDVTDDGWQDFVINKAEELLSAGVDGFFIDNVDAYYEYNSNEIFDSLAYMLKVIHSKGAYVIVNGGDVFVTEYANRNGSLDDILDGVNQECVYTAVDWENNSFTVNNYETREYYIDYLKQAMALGKDGYIIEYASDDKIASEAKSLADELGCDIYIANSLMLNLTSDAWVSGLSKGGFFVIIFLM